MSDRYQRAKLFLRDRRTAYTNTFTPNNLASNAVLKDLAKFCRAYKPTFHEDPRMHAALEGRREVWLRIQQHLNLSFDELMEQHNNQGALDE